jgi:hypothetical protein
MDRAFEVIGGFTPDLDQVFDGCVECHVLVARGFSSVHNDFGATLDSADWQPQHGVSVGADVND